MVDHLACIILTCQIIQRIRNISSIALGTGAGILKLESYWGFLFYLASSIIISVLITAIPAKGHPQYYFTNSTQSVWVDHIFGGLASFVLFWTLFYGLVSA